MSDKRNSPPKGKETKGSYRSWPKEAMMKALTDCNAGMGVK